MVLFHRPLKLWMVVVVVTVVMVVEGAPKKQYDKTIKRYTNEKTCWWNEICKEEFQQEFRCRCPRFSYCRSPGRYYNAYCSVMGSGYVWTQPKFPVHHQAPPPPPPVSGGGGGVVGGGGMLPSPYGYVGGK